MTAPKLATPIDQPIVLRDIGWEGYSKILEIRGESRFPKLIYLDGDLWFKSPTSYPHEHLESRLRQFVREVVVGLDIPCIPSGSTTFRGDESKAGVEADESFYLANEERIRGKKEIDLTVDPPPDLAIEVVYSNPAFKAVESYRNLGVPEVWVCDEDELVIRVLNAEGQYQKSTTSAVFPFLTVTEIFEWVNKPQIDSETRWIKDLRRWVAETLPARRRDLR